MNQMMMTFDKYNNCLLFFVVLINPQSLIMFVLKNLIVVVYYCLFD